MYFSPTDRSLQCRSSPESWNPLFTKHFPWQGIASVNDNILCLLLFSQAVPGCLSFHHQGISLTSAQPWGYSEPFLGLLCCVDARSGLHLVQTVSTRLGWVERYGLFLLFVKLTLRPDPPHVTCFVSSSFRTEYSTCLVKYFPCKRLPITVTIY